MTQTKSIPLILTAALALILSACAPTLNQHHNQVKLDAYYPLTPGLQWGYTTPGKTDSITSTITRNDGRKLTIHQHNQNGDLILIADFQQNRDGLHLSEITTGEYHRQYTPPMKVLPTERELNVGTTWTSQHTISETEYAGTHEQRTITWNATVTGRVDSRQIIRTAQTTHDAYNVLLNTTWDTAHDHLGKNTVDAFWVAPFTGLVTTPTGQVLTNTQLTHVERTPQE